MNHWIRFWLVVLSLVAGIAGFAVLLLSFLFPETSLFALLGSTERLVITILTAVAFGLFVWGWTTFGLGTGGNA